MGSKPKYEPTPREIAGQLKRFHRGKAPRLVHGATYWCEHGRMQYDANLGVLLDGAGQPHPITCLNGYGLDDYRKED